MAVVTAAFAVSTAFLTRSLLPWAAAPFLPSEWTTWTLGLELRMWVHWPRAVQMLAAPHDADIIPVAILLVRRKMADEEDGWRSVGNRC